MASYEFTTDLDLGAIGIRTVSIDYKRKHGFNEMVSIWVLDGKDIAFEITDWITWETEQAIIALMEVDHPKQLIEEAAYQADLARDRMAEASWEIAA